MVKCGFRWLYQYTYVVSGTCSETHYSKNSLTDQNFELAQRTLSWQAMLGTKQILGTSKFIANIRMLRKIRTKVTPKFDGHLYEGIVRGSYIQWTGRIKGGT